MRKKGTWLIAILAGMVLLASTAFAGSTGVITDDPQNDTHGLTAQTDADRAAGCDTLDPILTVNSAAPAYKCAPSADIKTWSFDTEAMPTAVAWPVTSPGRPCIPAGTQVLHAQFNMGGVIPWN